MRATVILMVARIVSIYITFLIGSHTISPILLIFRNFFVIIYIESERRERNELLERNC